MTRKKGLFKYILPVVMAVMVFACSNDPVVEEIDYSPQREAGIIDEYIDFLVEEGYDVDTTALGVFYVILEEGEGEFVQEGNSIGIKYVGFFPESGAVFDQSAYWYDNGIWKFTYPSSGVISGFNDAIGLLNPGARGLFLIPSILAYGTTGYGSVPPYSPLAFQIELSEIYE
ncbi:FKBP-type peptidyl-prolyl cis-trans isomerase [Gaoshiqia sp. Z1-71]|uniref:FKBP-type peptidyl-prolyl cis-trans isomerase n=1 Tax=Gaoshiqia hydrogeniformans TaxID=3290090 RepID=UPI003BF91F58